LISIDGDQNGEVNSTNVQGAKTAAEAALHCNVRRMIHVCSIHAFSQKPLDQPLDETRDRVSSKKHTAYDLSKAAGEAQVRLVIERGLDAVIIHPSGVIGPNDFMPSRMGRALIQFHQGKMLSVVQGGFNWVDVRDVVSAMIAAEKQGRCDESYLVGGYWQSVKTLTDMVEEVTGTKAPKLVTPIWLARIGVPVAKLVGRIKKEEPLFTYESLNALTANRQVCSDKAARELGHCPRPTIDTIRDTFAWFREHGKI